MRHLTPDATLARHFGSSPLPGQQGREGPRDPCPTKLAPIQIRPEHAFTYTSAHSNNRQTRLLTPNFRCVLVSRQAYKRALALDKSDGNLPLKLAVVQNIFEASVDAR